MAEEALKYGLLAFQMEQKSFAYDPDLAAEDPESARDVARASFGVIADMARLQATRMDD